MKRFGMFIAISFMVLALITGAAEAQVRDLKPSATSPTAMVKCGAKLEDVKAQIGGQLRYVFSGTEVLKQMRYCVSEASIDVVDTRNQYRVPKGTVGWLAPDGRVVLEGCVNDALCEGCSPPTGSATTRFTEPVAPLVPYRRLVVNFFQDDGSLEKQYLLEDSRWKMAFEQGRVEDGSAYRTVFTNAPFPVMLGKRNARPLVGQFNVIYLRREPSRLDIRAGDSPQVVKQKYFAYLTALRDPAADNVLSRSVVTSNKRGYVIHPLLPLDSFAMVVVFPVDPTVDLVGDIPIFMRSGEFMNGPEPAHVWAARRSEE